MKLILFICLSLFCSLMHAATMPAGLLADIDNKMVMASTSHHCDKAEQGDHQAKSHCPGGGLQCCPGFAIQSVTFFWRAPQRHSRAIPSIFIPLYSHTPDTLFRPPKAV